MLSQEKKLFVDMELPLRFVSEKLADSLALLTPFGIGNPTPVFQSTGKILFVKSMGKKQEHLKFVIQDLTERTKQLECVNFSPSNEQREMIIAGTTISIVYNLEAQYWQGRKKIQGMIKLVILV